MNEIREARPGKGLDFLTRALLAFACLGLEDLLMLFVEPLIFNCGGSFSKWPVWLHVFHWCIVSVLWASGAILLAGMSEKKCGFDVFGQKEKMNPVRWLLCLALLAVSVAVSVWDWNGFKVVEEFQYNGWIKFIFQYIYYLFETVLVVLIIASGQKAGEVWFHRDRIPWGGIRAHVGAGTRSDERQRAGRSAFFTWRGSVRGRLSFGKKERARRLSAYSSDVHPVNIPRIGKRKEEPAYETHFGRSRFSK